MVAGISSKMKALERSVEELKENNAAYDALLQMDELASKLPDKVPAKRHLPPRESVVWQSQGATPAPKAPKAKGVKRKRPTMPDPVPFRNSLQQVVYVARVPRLHDGKHRERLAEKIQEFKEKRIKPTYTNLMAIGFGNSTIQRNKDLILTRSYAGPVLGDIHVARLQKEGVITVQ